MADWLEDLKIQRSKQTRNDHYQQYQAYLDEVDKMDNSALEQVGKLHGKSFRWLVSEKNETTHLFKNIISNK